MREPLRKKCVVASGVRKMASASIAVALAAAMCVPFAGSAYGEDEAVALEDATEAPAFEGADVVLRYLDGLTPTLDELSRIDFEALAAWDADVAKELRALRDALAAEAAGPDASGDEMADEGGTEEADGEAGASAGAETDGSDAVMAVPSVAPDEVPASEDPFDATQTYPEWSYSGDTSFTMVHYTADMDAQKLIAAIGEQARIVAQEEGVSASEMIALAVIKSDSGRSVAAQAPSRNLFRTVDETAGDGSLASYETYGACLADHAARVAAGIEDAVPDDASWAGAHASLAERVQAVIDDFDLARYDAPLPYEPAEALTVQAWDEAAEALVDVPVQLSDVVDEAASHLGVPYVWGGATPEGFDCSGLVQHAYANAWGIELPRTSYYQCTVGQDVDFADLHMGDLLFFAKDGVVGHVAMYLGEGCYIEAPQPGMEVKITAMDEKVPTFAKRIVGTVPVSEEEQAEAQAVDAETAAARAEASARQEEQAVAARTYALWKEHLS